jgi:class 3 adenylate cyclase/CHASE2 domain-containing sensor protein
MAEPARQFGQFAFSSPEQLVLLGVFCLTKAVRLSFLKSPTFIIATPVIIGVCVLEVLGLSALDRLELMTFDARARLAHRFRPTSSNTATNLGLVEISDNTIYAVKHGHLGFDYGLYWPRDVYAAGLKELTLEGAKAVAFDVLFADARDDQAMVAAPDGSITAPDDIFAAQLKKSGNVILAADSDEMPILKFATNAWQVANIAVDRDADSVLRRDRAYKDYRVWDPVIQDAASQLQWNLPKTIDDRPKHKITFFSQLNNEPAEYPIDDAGTIASSNFLNTIPLGFPARIVPYRPFRAWSLGILLASYELKLDLDHPDFEPGRIVLHGPNGLTRAVPVDDQGYFYIDWSLTQNDPQVKQGAFEWLLAAPILRKQGEPFTNVWKDKLVIIGSTATGNDLADIGATPLQKSTFLVNKHLNVANSVISGRFVHKTPLPLDLALIILVGVLSAWLTWVVERPFQGTLLMLAFAAVYVALCAWLYLAWRLWVPIFLPMVCAGFVTHLTGVLHRVRFEQTEKKKVKQIFSRLVSPDVVNEVLDKETLRVGGQRREITIYFADVRGFTELTDVTQAHAVEYVKEHNLRGAEAEAYFDAQAKETLETVSTYLGIIADVIKSHKGLLDKYIGDCVMAFWGAPLPNPHHALDAVRAAIQAQRAMAELNLDREQKNKQREAENAERAHKGLPRLSPLPALSMGTGINTGVAIVGLMGSETHLVNYTAFGREVNLASRLEGVSGHGRIIIGEATFEALKRDDPQLAASCLELAPQHVKGFRTAVRIYEVPWRPSAAVPQPPAETGAIQAPKPAAV